MKPDSGMDDDGGAGRGEEDLDFNLADESDEENLNFEEKTTNQPKNILAAEEDPSKLGILDAHNSDDEADKYLGQNDDEDDPMLTAEDMLIKKNLLENQKIRKEQKQKGVEKEKLAKAARTSKQIKDEMGMLTDMFSNNLYDSKENQKSDSKKAKVSKKSRTEKSERKPSDDTDILVAPPVPSHLLPLGMKTIQEEKMSDDEGVLLPPTVDSTSAGHKIQKELNRKRKGSGNQEMSTDSKSPVKKLKLADKPIYKSPGQIRAEEIQAKKMRKEQRRMKKAKKAAKKEIKEQEEFLKDFKPGSLLKMGTKIESTSNPSKKKKVNAWLEAQADKKRSIKSLLKDAKNVSLKGGVFESPIDENLGHKSWDKFNEKQRKEALIIGQSARMDDMLKSKERRSFMLQKMTEIESRKLTSYEDVAF